MGTFIFTLVGSLIHRFGKWQLVMQLASNHHFWLLAIILLRSLFEGVYLFRWLGYAIKWDEENRIPKIKLHQFIPTALFAGLTYALGFLFWRDCRLQIYLYIYGYRIHAFLYIVDFLPVYIKNTLAIGAMALYYFHIRIHSMG